jgi:hypothetical protein
MVKYGQLHRRDCKVSIDRPDYTLTAVIGGNDGLCRQQRLIAGGV